jgi:hypothetical protein
MAFRVSLLIPVCESSVVERHGTDERSTRLASIKLIEMHLAPTSKKIFLSLLNELERSDTKIFSRYLAVLGHHIYHDSSRHFYTLAL